MSKSSPTIRTNRQLWLTWILSTSLTVVFGVGGVVVMILHGSFDQLPAAAHIHGLAPLPAWQHIVAVLLFVGAIVEYRVLLRRGHPRAACYVAWIPLWLILLLGIHLSQTPFHAPVPHPIGVGALWILPAIGMLTLRPPAV